MFYKTFEKSFESVVEKLKQMCSKASTNCDLSILSQMKLSQINCTDQLHSKLKTVINIPIQTRAAVS